MLKEQADNIIISELENLKQRIIANIQANKQTTSGRTAASFFVEPTENGIALKTSQGNIMFQTLETGRKPGKIPLNFTHMIWQWIIDKGISVKPINYIRQASENWQPMYSPQERGELSLAGAIAHKIKTEGTELFQKGGRKDVYSNEIPKTITEIKTKILGIFKIEFSNIKLN